MTSTLLPTRPGSPPVAIITIPGVGKVAASHGLLRPRTHVVAQRLGVGSTAADVATLARQAAIRYEVERLATETLGASEIGWMWEAAD